MTGTAIIVFAEASEISSDGFDPGPGKRSGFSALDVALYTLIFQQPEFRPPLQ